MKKYEYKVVETKYNTLFRIEEALEKFNNTEWEVISVVPAIANGSTEKYFITAKRLIHQKKKTSSPKPAKIW